MKETEELELHIINTIAAFPDKRNAAALLYEKIISLFTISVTRLRILFIR